MKTNTFVIAESANIESQFKSDFLLNKVSNYSYLLNDGSQFNPNQSLLDAIDSFLFFSSMILYGNQSFVDWNTSLTFYQPNFYFPIYNGYSTIFNEISSIEGKANQIYTDLLNSYSIHFNLVIALYFFISCILLVVLLPIIFRIRKITGEVLSLFGFIKEKDIDQNLKSIQKFNIDFLKNDETYYRNRMLMEEFNDDLDENQEKVKNSGLFISLTSSQKQNITQNEKNSFLKENNVKEDEEEIIENRKSNLQKMKLKEILSLYPTISILVLILLVFITLDYILLNRNYLELQTNLLNRLYLNNQRVETLEMAFSISTENLYSGKSNIGNKSYIDFMYTIESKIFQNYKDYTGISKFSSYESIFESLSFGDICINYYKNKDLSLVSGYCNNLACNSVANGVLTKGFRTANVAILESFRELQLLNQNQIQNPSASKISGNLNSPLAENISF